MAVLLRDAEFRRRNEIAHRAPNSAPYPPTYRRSYLAPSRVKIS